MASMKDGRAGADGSDHMALPPCCEGDVLAARARGEMRRSEVLGDATLSDSAEVVREGELQEEALEEVGRESWDVNDPVGELGARDQEGEEERGDVRVGGLCSFCLARGERILGEVGGGARERVAMPAGRVSGLVVLVATKALEGGRRRGMPRLRLRNSASCRCCRSSCPAPHGQHGAIIPPTPLFIHRPIIFAATRGLLPQAPYSQLLSSEVTSLACRNQVRHTEQTGPPPRAAAASSSRPCASAYKGLENVATTRILCEILDLAPSR